MGWFIHSQGPPGEIYLDSRCGVTRKVCVSRTPGDHGHGAPIFPLYARVIPSLGQSPKTSRQCHPGALLEPSPAQQFRGRPRVRNCCGCSGFTWTTVAAGHYQGQNHRWAGRCRPRILGEESCVHATVCGIPAAARAQVAALDNFTPLVSTSRLHKWAHACLGLRANRRTRVGPTGGRGQAWV